MVAAHREGLSKRSADWTGGRCDLEYGMQSKRHCLEIYGSSGEDLIP
jgi:hypothetical protein